jgi:hypothetical protein
VFRRWVEIGVFDALVETLSELVNREQARPLFAEARNL